jgi:hypothetical protein
LAFANPTITEDRAMTTASPPACQRVNPRRQPATLPSSYTTTRDTTLRTFGRQFDRVSILQCGGPVGSRFL